jgi:type I restriction enzyme S subunit
VEIRVSTVDKKSIEGQTPVRLCNYTDVYYRDSIAPNQEFMVATATSEQVETFGLRAGDVIITKDSETPDDIGVPAFVAESAADLVCGYHLAVLRPKPGAIDGQYLHWSMSSHWVSGQLAARATGVTRFGLRTDVIANTLLKVPLPEDQRRIARLLESMGREVARTRGRLRRLAELITERLGALAERLIGHSSGVPTRLKFICQVQQGWSPAADPIRAGPAEVGMLKLSAVSGARFLPEHNRAIRKELLDTTPWEHWALQEGDVLLTRASGSKHLVGRVCRVQGLQSRRLVFSDLIYRLSPVSGDLDSDYLSVALRANSLRSTLLERTRGSANNKIRVEDVRELSVPLPEPNEQRRIAKEFSMAELSTKSLLDRIDQQLNLLTERRDALITAAVTGQLDPSSYRDSVAGASS